MASTSTGETTESATEGEDERRKRSLSFHTESSSPKKRKGESEGLMLERRRRIPPKSLPFVNIDFGSSSDVEKDDDDPTFDPSHLEISLVEEGNRSVEANSNRENIGLEEEVHDLEIGADEGEDDDEYVPPSPPLPSSKGVRAIPQKEKVTLDDIKEEKYIIYKSSLMAIIKKISLTCKVKNCRNPVLPHLTQKGSAVAVSWICAASHEVYSWTSQPQLPNGIYLGNFQASTAVTLSGNNFTKVALFAKFLGMGFPTKSSYNRVQSKYVAPVVEKYWDNLKSSTVEEHRSARIIVSGDGRMDSPGYSAKYCTYTVMNQGDKNILEMKIIDKRECMLKSGLMEAEGFRRSVASLQENGVILEEIVTDAHPQIASIMKKNFPNIRHSYDMWHGAKNLGKKLASVACSKGNEELKPWLGDITNHFFYSADNCDGKVEIMQAKWVSMLNHIVNRHSWALGECDHEPIQDEGRDKAWLSPHSRVYDDLQRAILEPRLLKSFHYYTTCQTTSELESFNNHILMYAPKRSAFGYESYKCRCYLAAIDYTKHLQRDTLRDKNGNKQYKRKFSKGSNNWTSSEAKVPKQYSYIPSLIEAIVNEYCGGHLMNPLRAHMLISDEDPRNIASTIAPREPPPTAQLAERKKPRIKKKD